MLPCAHYSKSAPKILETDNFDQMAEKMPKGLIAIIKWKE